uniref:Polygalacturonase n=1 Tax=Cannabis sativa TaxID=3483 RepID=A0A803Q3U8_CANSA
MFMLSAAATPTTTSFNVLLGFGAKPDGITDSTDSFLRAWEAACASTDDALIYVPKGRYLVRPLAFKGPCKSLHITVRIDGTLVAPEDYQVLGGSENWLNFQRVSGVSIVGGALDARGPAFQMFHIVINHCENVEMRGVKIIAHGDSPNTDGIHVQLSKNVAIFNSVVGTGDDCVSIGPGTQNLWIERMTCGPGHGISIGSLAKNMEEEGVQNVTVKQIIFTGTQNGIRIKSWAKLSNGFVESVHFSNIVMRNVQNPIIIDQNYCPSHINCPTEVSGIKINNITYKNIKGTSATLVATKFDCSSGNPCNGIRLEDINLTFRNKSAQSFCANANGKSFGSVLPDSCLSN